MRAEQQSPRFKRRLPCNLAYQGRRDSGIVLNLSEGGLYVQTNLGARRGSIVDVAVQSPSGSQPIALRARVVWKRVKNSRIVGVERSGLGLEIQCPGDDYEGLIQDVGGGGEQDGRAGGNPPGWESPRQPSGSARSADSETAKNVAAPQAPAYRMRLKLEGSPRSKTLRIHASSPSEALSRIVDECGPGWEVLEIEEL